MSYTLIRESERTARKPYRCIWCGERITPGERYFDEFSKFDGDVQKHRWHPECRTASIDYFDAGDGPEFEAHNNERPAATIIGCSKNNLTVKTVP